jgi:fumarate reductase (CoM/CoB) subunit B
VQVKCDIYRFEPGAGEKARYDTHVLEADSTDTVLGLLLRINHESDSTLSFRFACGVVKCGECGIMVNGTPCLACEKVVDGEMKIDPLDLPLIKDLVVNRKEVFSRIARTFPSLAESRKGGASFDPEAADTFVRLTKCFECLICQSTCPIYAEKEDHFVGPLGLLWAAQTIANGSKDSILKTAAENMLGMCTRCGACSQACPCSEDILSLALTTLDK